MPRRANGSELDKSLGQARYWPIGLANAISSTRFYVRRAFFSENGSGVRESTLTRFDAFQRVFFLPRKARKHHTAHPRAANVRTRFYTFTLLHFFALPPSDLGFLRRTKPGIKFPPARALAAIYVRIR